MYIAAIIVLMLVLPLLSVAAEAAWIPGSDLLAVIGRWFVFWGVGVRLFLAGINQVFRPRFTAEGIFGIGDPAAHGLVREVGFGNLAMGTLGMLSLVVSGWVVPAAIVGGLFFGLAGLGHLVRKDRDVKEQVAFVSDLAMFALLAAFVASRAL